MAIIYASSTAAGSNNGTSWTNAYTNLQTAITAMAAGDVLYTNAPFSSPFRTTTTFSVTGKDGCRIIGDKGPNGATYVTSAAVSASWVDAGGGIFSLSGFAGEPPHVAYDFKQDDYLGTVTGVVIDQKVAAYAARLGWHPSVLRAWYGFMPKTSGTQTAPGEGEYGYSAGVLYVNPPGAPNLATMQPLTWYAPSTAGQVFDVADCDHFRIEGMTPFWSPQTTGNNGYGISCGNCTDAEIARCLFIANGWHSAGFQGGYGGNVGNYDCRISDCLANGCTGDESGSSGQNPFVFYQHSAPTRWGNNTGARLVAICNPRLRTTGRPTYNGFRANPFLSHSVSGTSYENINWIDCVGYDFADPLITKHTITNTNVGSFILHSQGPEPSNALDGTTYPVKCKRCVCYGRMLLTSSRVACWDLLVDRSGHGTSSINGITFNTTSVKMWFSNLHLLTGNMADSYFTQVGSDDSIVFTGDRNRVLDEGTVNRKAFLLQASDTGTTDNVYMTNMDIDAAGGTNRSVLLAGGTIYTNNFRDVFSGGGNRFGSSLEGTLQHTNPGNAPQNMAAWQSLINGGSADTGLTSLGWGSTAAEKAEYVRSQWMRLCPPPRAFTGEA
jgi:hypothetical protein